MRKKRRKARNSKAQQKINKEFNKLNTWTKKNQFLVFLLPIIIGLIIFLIPEINNSFIKAEVYKNQILQLQQMQMNSQYTEMYTVSTEMLKEITPKRNPVDYAYFKLYQGIAILNGAVDGNQIDNLNLAKMHFKEALYYYQEHTPYFLTNKSYLSYFNVALAQDYIGISYQSLSTLNAESNLKNAIYWFNKEIETLDEDDNLRKLKMGNRERDLLESLIAFQTCRALNNLGYAYYCLSLIEDTDHNMELAYDSYMTGYEHLHKQRMTEEDYYALLSFYSFNIPKVSRYLFYATDNVDYLENIIDTYEHALEIWPVNVNPQYTKNAYIGLCQAYFDYYKFTHIEEHRISADNYYNKALKMVLATPKDILTLSLLETNSNHALYNSVDYNNVESIIAASEEYLNSFELLENPMEYASVQLLLGTLYNDMALIKETPININKAIDYLENARNVFEGSGYNSKYKECIFQLLNAYNFKTQITHNKNDIAKQEFYQAKYTELDIDPTNYEILKQTIEQAVIESGMTIIN